MLVWAFGFGKFYWALGHSSIFDIDNATARWQHCVVMFVGAEGTSAAAVVGATGTVAAAVAAAVVGATGTSAVAVVGAAGTVAFAVVRAAGTVAAAVVRAVGTAVIVIVRTIWQVRSHFCQPIVDLCTG